MGGKTRKDAYWHPIKETMVKQYGQESLECFSIWCKESAFFTGGSFRNETII